MRFSLLSVFAITAYIAILSAALLWPLSNWPHIGVLAWLFLLLYFIAIAVDPSNGSRSTVARAIVVSILAYVLLSSNDVYFYETGLPHHWFTLWWSVLREREIAAALSRAGQPPSATFALGALPQSMRIFSLLNCSLLFGLLGGAMTAWRIRRSNSAALVK